MAQASASRGKDWWWCGTLVEKVKSVYFFALDRDQGLGGGAVAPLPMAYCTASQMDTYYCSAVLLHCLCVHGRRKKLVNENGVEHSSLFQSQGPYLLHPCLTLATYILYYAPLFLLQETKA